MKQLLYPIVFLFPVLALAQSTEQNYIKTTAYKVGTQNGTTQTTGGAAVTDAHKTVNVGYFDGMGRPIQQVAYKQSAEGKNIIVPITYDDKGRKTRDYLPFPSQSTSLLYTDNTAVIPSLESFYAGEFGNAELPYSEKQLESSPLNRVQKQSAPGADWKLPATPTAADHTIRFEYLTNTANEVRLFTATASSPSAGQYSIALVKVGYYAAGQLFKNKVKDENWKTGDGNNNSTDEFKDKQGRVVLKRNYESGEAYDTYYVYDQYGNLTYVIPPKVDTGSTVSTVAMAGLCYQYKYDHRNRLVEKKLPGKQWEYIVYDRMDRVVATGPANAPFTDLVALDKKGWLVTKYDAFNRTVLTAWKEAVFGTTTRKDLQDYHDSRTVLSEARATSETTIGGVAFKYTNLAEPTADYHILTINYYDDYGFTSATEWVPLLLSPTSLGQEVYYTKTRKPKGLATGSWVRVLEASTAYRNERSYILYDVKSRPVLTFKRNHLQGTDFNYTLYDFEGKVLQTQTTHTKVSGGSSLTVNDYFTYSDQGRLLLHTHKTGSGAVQLLARNTYDKLGQLKSKKVGGEDTTGLTCLQNVHYGYNIRGWLKEINKMNSLAQTGDPTDLFAFALNYNTVANELKNDAEAPVRALYNGNISETFWKTSSDGLARKYGYRYDNLNRLRAAVYQKPDLGSGLPVEVTHSYDETISYDKNGNIMSLQRNGYLDNDDPGLNYQIDNLAYTYGPSSNQLAFVVDQSNSLDGFRDGQNIVANRPDYGYDDNGNMVYDWNKKIQSITYNHLNLPVKISFYVGTGQRYIDYIYNAVGVKVGKRVFNSSPDGPAHDNSTEYLGGFQYLDNVLQFFPTAEGYVNAAGGSYNYVFNYTDHLGNVRLSYSKDPLNGQLKILEQSHYYPYGMKHANYNDSKHDFKEGTGGGYAIIDPVERSNYQYKYNGKELQDELSLNWYDYGARNYDTTIGRWMNIDPLSEKFFSYTPYSYVTDSPIGRFDPDGMDVYFVNEEGRFILALKEQGNDRLYAIHTTNQDIFGFTYIKLWDDKEADMGGGIEIQTSGLLGQMLNYKGDGVSRGTYYSIIAQQSNVHVKDVTKIFRFLANLTDIEYSLTFFSEGGKDLIQLSTYRHGERSPSPDNLEIQYKNVQKQYHSHPKVKTDIKSERSSMGDRGDGWISSGLDNDFHKANRLNRTYPNYVYFPDSSRLYLITTQSINYIRKINSSNDF